MSPGRELTASLERHAADYLELEHAAVRHYRFFLLGDEAQARALRDAIHAGGDSDFGPPHGRLLLDDGRPVGMVCAMGGAELKRLRLLVAVRLMRARLVGPDVMRRMQLAAKTLLAVQDDEYYLARVAVDAAARGRGHGDFLLQRYLADARAGGFRRCVLETATGNDKAIALFARHGLSVIGEETVTDQETGRSLGYVHMAGAVPTAAG